MNIATIQTFNPQIQFPIVVWVADVGKIPDNFGWCRAEMQNGAVVTTGGTDIKDFVSGIAADISEGYSVALGFECPLFVPVPPSSHPQQMTSARTGEGNRSWSAAGGCGALATGLPTCVWVFEQIKELSSPLVTIEPTFDWRSFLAANANLFIWEAFVTGNAKGTSHQSDAELAAREFWRHFPNIIAANTVTAQSPFSLVGSALIRGGLTMDTLLLHKPCVVIKV